jgi:hypothetical protein
MLADGLGLHLCGDRKNAKKKRPPPARDCDVIDG